MSYTVVGAKAVTGHDLIAKRVVVKIPAQPTSSLVETTTVAKFIDAVEYQDVLTFNLQPTPQGIAVALGMFTPFAAESFTMTEEQWKASVLFEVPVPPKAENIYLQQISGIEIPQR